jgi:hypothetical protein
MPIIGNHELVLINITWRLFNLHMWFVGLCIDIWVVIIDTIVPMWILIWFQKQVCIPFARAKSFLAFQVCDFICEGWTKAYFLTISTNSVTLRKRNSFLLNPYLKGPLSWIGNTMSFAWKFKHSHQLLQHTHKLPLSPIIEMICYA